MKPCAEEVREAVHGRYANLPWTPRGVRAAVRTRTKLFGPDRYREAARAELPETAALASLGCGNPTAVADLHLGEVVPDLGSGGDIDVFLSARRVGPTGEAFGLDMTDEMLDLERQRRRCHQRRVPGGQWMS